MRCLVIEDDPVWELKIGAMLDAYAGGVEKVVASSLQSAQATLKSQHFDFHVVDIVLPDGLSLQLQEKYFRGVPTVYITAFPNHGFFNKSLQAPHAHFLVKPFHSYSFHSVLKSILPEGGNEESVTQGVYISGHFKSQVFVGFADLVYVRTDQNYIHIYTLTQHHIIKKSLLNFLAELDKRFIQIHKTVVVNQHYIDRFDPLTNSLHIKGKVFPVGRSYRAAVLSLFNK